MHPLMHQVGAREGVGAGYERRVLYGGQDGRREAD